MNNVESFKENMKIPVGCRELEEIEDNLLAPWATKHSEIDYKDLAENKEETYRTRFRRDKDRILYSKAFRRLQYKTQVIGVNTGDDFRTRLTHSLEVEQIATSIASALDLNKDLVSAIALGHDLGHTPFGHAVERLINKELHPFSHAVQSVRYLEDQAKDREGLNISLQVLEGILKHDTDIFSGAYETTFKNQHDCSHLSPSKPGSLESQVVYWADKIAYLSHDFEDFKRMGIFDEAVKSERLDNNELEQILSKLISDTQTHETRDIIRNVINNLIKGSIENLAATNPKSSQDAIEITADRYTEPRQLKDTPKQQYQNSLLINFEDSYRKEYNKLREILTKHYLGSPEIRRSDKTAGRIVSQIIKEFAEDQQLLPLKIQSYVDGHQDSLKQAIADYIASMTDRMALNMHRKIFEIADYNQYE